MFWGGAYCNKLSLHILDISNVQLQIQKQNEECEKSFRCGPIDKKNYVHIFGSVRNKASPSNNDCTVDYA